MDDVRCLCHRHLRDYIDRSNYIVRRANPYAVAKEQCDWCNRPGYDYFVIERLANERRKKND